MTPLALTLFLFQCLKKENYIYTHTQTLYETYYQCGVFTLPSSENRKQKTENKKKLTKRKFS